MRHSHVNSKLVKTLVSLAILQASFTNPSYAMELVPTIEDAIIHNPEFREQLKVYQGTQAELDGAEGSWLPTVDIAAGIGLEETDNVSNGSSTSLTRKESSIRITENLFEGFKTENEIDRQQAKMDAAAYSAEAKANQIALDMTEAYVNLLKEQELLRLEGDNKKTHERILDQITQRTDAGIGNQVEVDQAKARLALANSNEMAARNNYNDALSRFQRVLGRMPDNDLIKPSVEFQLPASLTEATDIALLNHPTLRSANADIAEAQAQHRSAKSTYYPRFDIEIEKRWDEDINGIEGKDENLQAMLRMRYNLYNGGKDSANRNRTAAAVQQSAEIRNNARRQTIENLRYAWSAKKYVGEQLVYIKEHIKLTYETLEGYRKQFSIGRRSLLDLLNTEDEYNSALRTLVTSESEYLIAQYRILNGMGTLLDTLQVNVKYATVESDYSNQ
ncbi:TolC family outer membrane protein [Thiomicrorhabdus lithotrophica]|uniref:TolC family outer membrane protein n=1 Tax=Thiomicrorhabdus lithotrophica TaxID=2949997 RepID=A0ABY8CAB6_9GAMM|nr:TolC family outer membrane protein [Thiomicrorhabdus lithotrophica]WEJ62916.1 TolC family outer membrane protein [Thiomicrorhabdus lithotrophica]